MSKRLFVISNRLPVNITVSNGSADVTESTGGLVTAISSFINNAQVNDGFEETYWAGVPGCNSSTWKKIAQQLVNKEFHYVPVFIKKNIYDKYYNGLSNSTIWPIFHYFPSYAEYNSDHYEKYLLSNEEFFNQLKRQLKADDTVWIHDYHLLPLASMIRKEFPEITIGFFLHIPFPCYEVFRIIPDKWQKDMLEGMLGADLIGFHTMDYASHFLKSVQLVLGYENDMHIVQYKNRLVKVDAFPISIDYTKFSEAYDDEQVVQVRDTLKKQFGTQKVIFSVDRLDYTKGVHNRLRAFEKFIESNPQYREQVIFVMVVVPSRDAISKYAERKKMIDEYIGNLNSRIGTINWQPVIYQYNTLNFQELVAMYTACDLALITPLRDGMNLVAKEFVASRKDERGVLVLSEMAGAAKELSEALAINPNDIEDIAEKIRYGLEMEETEQHQRMTKMRTAIRSYDVVAWASDYFAQLKKIRNRQHAFKIKLLDTVSRNELTGCYQNAASRLILLDYDGTLRPFVAQPSQASPGAELLHVLMELGENPENDVFVISGRDSKTLEKWLGHLPVNLISEHGAGIKYKHGEWYSDAHPSVEWRSLICSIMEHYVLRCSGSFIELKDFSVVWHFRNCEADKGMLRATELYNELLDYTNSIDIQVIKGNKIIEVRTKGINKGIAIKKIIKDNYDFILACGDDTTDEDMFLQLSENPKAYTIKVGMSASYAKYNVYDPGLMLSLLGSLGADVYESR